MKHNYFTVCLAAAALALMAPPLAAQPDIGGQPPSFADPGLTNSVHTVTMPPVNVEALLAEDAIEAEEGKPYRFGKAHSSDIGIDNAGTWMVARDGSRVWRLRIACPAAFSINLIFNSFYLPEGALLYLYNQDRSSVLGAYTARNNKDHGEFATSPIPGSVVTLEYVEPPVPISQARISISHVIHGYKDFMNHFAGFGQSQACNNNVNCPEGDDWCREKRAVSMILLNLNTRWCSGSLLNNVRQDLTPYYLTANHCLTASTNTWIFWFGYWSDLCSPTTDQPNVASFVGATLRANIAESDFALLEMDDEPYSPHGVHYAGWNRVDAPAQSSVGIHHPQGDVMKISFDNDPPVSGTWIGTPPDTYWEVYFDDGTAEHGSSGSPLFDENHRVIGQLTGNIDPLFTGSNYCEVPHIWFGKFSHSWDRPGATSANRLKDWLDPDDTGVETLDALSPAIYYRNRTINSGTLLLTATETMEVEGDLPAPTVPPNTAFTIGSGADVSFKAGEEISIKNGVHFEEGSSVHAFIGDVSCSDGVTPGDYKQGTAPEYTDDIGLPGQTAAAGTLLSNYPNPARSSTFVEYRVRDESAVSLTLSDVYGRKIKDLINDPQHPVGTYSVQLYVDELPSGTYYYTLRTADYSITKTLTVIK